MEALIGIVNEATASNNYASLHNVFTNGWNAIGQGEQRSLAAHFIHSAVIREPQFLQASLQRLSEIESVYTTALGHLPTTVPDAADNKLRQALFEAKIGGEDPDYAAAANILSGLRMEEPDAGSVYSMPAVDRTDVYVKIAECYLVEDEIGASESAVNRAGACLEQVPDAASAHPALVLRYKSTCARVLDANRKFLAAAQRYHELCSVDSRVLLEEEELLQILGKAATCAILAPHGPQRARVLNLIANDGRISQLDGLKDFQSHRAILLQMQRLQIIRKESPELQHLREGLAEHQTAVMGDGLTLLDRGIMDHNLSAISVLYRSIYLKTLAQILGVSIEMAQETVLERILKGGLRATLDGVEGVVTFLASKTPQEAFDDSISGFCQELTVVTTEIRSISAQVPSN